MILADTHTHLYAKEFNEDRAQVMSHSFQEGVSRLFLPNIDYSSMENMLELVKQYPENCFPMLGLHPCSIKLDYEAEWESVREYFNRKETKYYAVGEIGLDFYWDTTFAEQQKIAFRKQIDFALQEGLPIIIHVRKAWKETLEIVQEYADKDLRGIFHCFSGSLEEAKQVMSLKKFKLGIGGVVTFKNGGLSEVVPHIPMEYLVLETDAPYLAPVPHRGKRNESSYLTLIAQKVAELKNCSIEEVAEQTTQNSINVFGR